MESAIEQFLRWEASTRDTVDFKKAYVDIAGDLVAGLALGEIVYWHLPKKQGDSKLRVEHNGVLWIAARRHECWERARISPKQADRALSILEQKGLIAKAVFKFDGDPTVHVSLIWDRFLPTHQRAVLSPPENPFDPYGKNVIPQRSKTELTFREVPLTETTTETTNKKIPDRDNLLDPAPPPKKNAKRKNARRLSADDAAAPVPRPSPPTVGFRTRASETPLIKGTAGTEDTRRAKTIEPLMAMVRSLYPIYPVYINGERRVFKPLELRRFAAWLLALQGYSLEAIREWLGVAQPQTVLNYLGGELPSRSGADELIESFRRDLQVLLLRKG